MALELPASAPDLFTKTPTQGTVSLGGVMSRVLRDDQAVRKQMTAAEQAAVDALLKNVGTPDEYNSYMVYVLRALPYVKSAYGALDVTQPILPSDDEIAVLMRDRYLH